MTVFPAFFRKAEADIPVRLLPDEDESGCYNHPGKKAEAVCGTCGRFLCALCDLRLNGQHICPACLDIGKQKGRMRDLDTHRVRYDIISLYLAVLPVAVIFLTFITAPLALFIGIRYWNSPSGIVSKTKFIFMTAIFFSFVQIIGWAILIFQLLSNI